MRQTHRETFLWWACGQRNARIMNVVMPTYRWPYLTVEAVSDTCRAVWRWEARTDGKMRLHLEADVKRNSRLSPGYRLVSQPKASA
jgi:hypothetical protein